MITAADQNLVPRRRPKRGDPRRMRRPRWRRPGQAPHGSGQRRPRRPQWPGRLPGRAAGAPQREVPRHGPGRWHVASSAVCRVPVA